MVVVRLAGGLGNQLFQFAAGHRVAGALKATLLLDPRFLGTYQSKYTYDIGFVAKHYPGVEVGKPGSVFLDITERFRLGRIFDSAAFPLALVSSAKAVSKLLANPRAKTVVMDGYFQHPDVILDENERRRLYDRLFAECGALRNKIAPQDAPLVGVHIRRGDYVTSPASNRFLTVPISYYHEAAARIKDACFLVFGDDRSVTDSLARDLKGIDGRKLALSLQEEFLLLAFCDHYIIANSTFSWWASFLGWQSGKRLICPKQWFHDSERSRTNPLLLPHFELL